MKHVVVHMKLFDHTSRLGILTNILFSNTVMCLHIFSRKQMQVPDVMKVESMEGEVRIGLGRMLYLEVHGQFRVG